MRLLVNADDLGLHADIDRGILQCIDAGRVQSVSFSPNGQTINWQQLDELGRHGVRVGLHVTLVGEPWLTDGRVVPGWKQLITQVLLHGQVMRAAVESEVRRQFQQCAEHGLRLSHVDSHQHVHAFDGIWQPVTRLASEMNVPRVRVPWCPSWRVMKKSLGGIALQAISRRRRKQQPAALPCLGLTHAGHNDAGILAHELAHAGGGDVELVMHPGVNTPELEARFPQWRFEWTLERDALLSREFADAVAARGYEWA